MSRSNEFTARSLSAAIRKATVVYALTTRNDEEEREKRRICEQLERDLEFFKRDADRLLDRAEDLKREADSFRQSGRDKIGRAAIEALIAASGALGTSARALRALRALRFRDLSRRDWLGLVPLIGGGFLALSDLKGAFEDFREGERLAQKAEREIANANRAGADIVRIANEFRAVGCGNEGQRRPGVS